MEDNGFSQLIGYTIKDIQTEDGDNVLIETEDGTFVIQNYRDWGNVSYLKLFGKHNFRKYKNEFSDDLWLDYGWITQEEYDKIQKEIKRNEETRRIEECERLISKLGSDKVRELLNEHENEI